MNSRSFKIVAGLLCLIFLFSTYLLIDRQSNQLLWGHLPLFQFSSFWLLGVFLFKRKSLANRDYLNKIGLATLAALLLSIGFPPFPFPVLLFVALVPLLWILEPLVRKDNSRYSELFFLVYHSFLLWNIFTTYWVANTAYFAGIFANTVNAFLMTLPVFSYVFVVRKLGKNTALMAFVVSWLTFEFLHMRWELYWPWLTLGNGLAKIPQAIQWYNITGALGGSAWILMINYLIFSALDKYVANKSFKPLIKPALWILVPALFSMTVYYPYHETGDEIEVVSVQPNFEPHYEKFNFPQLEMVARCMKLAQGQITPQTDFVVMPETTFAPIDMNAPFRSAAIQELSSFASHNQVNVVTGLAGYRYLDDPGEINLSTTIPIERPNGIMEYREHYNCAIQIDPEQNIQEYYKALYVPGAEFFPFKNLLFFLQPLVDQLGGTTYGYRVRTKFALFTSDAAVVAPPICYESIFGEFITRFVQKGAEVIFIMTNDGWWDNTAGHRQHADFARLRAIETRRTVVRSANMGTCCIINQRGDISQKTFYGEAAAINVKARKNHFITFYVKWGDYIGRLSLFLTLLLLARAFVFKLRG
jgi:apolipoprotein N-acyltransferase